MVRISGVYIYQLNMLPACKQMPLLRSIMKSWGRSNCVPLFEPQEIEIDRIPRLDNATLRELEVNTIGAQMRLKDAACNYQG